MRDLGTTLASLRAEKGLVQKQMAASLNLSISAISSYENNVHAPDLSMLCRLAEYFNVTTDYLLGLTEFRFPPEAIRQHIARDYDVLDMVNTVLSLDRERQTSAIDFVKFLKQSHSEASALSQTPHPSARPASNAKPSDTKALKTKKENGIHHRNHDA